MTPTCAYSPVPFNSIGVNNLESNEIFVKDPMQKMYKIKLADIEKIWFEKDEMVIKVKK